MCLLRLWLGTIFSMAIRPVSMSRVAGRLAGVCLRRPVAGRLRLLAQVGERFLVMFGLLGVTYRGLFGFRLRSQLDAIFSIAVRPVFLSLAGDHLVGDRGLGLRQRHRLSGYNHVQFARKQDHESALLADAAGYATGIVASAPID